MDGPSCPIDSGSAPSTTRVARKLRYGAFVALLLLFAGSAAFAQTTLTPATLSFGNEALQVPSAVKTAAFKNTQTAPVTISDIIISGPNGGDFISGGNCPLSPNQLAAKASCSITVTFTPTVLGAETAALTVTDNASTSPQSLALTGTGVAPVTLTPATLAFGNQAQGTTSAAKTVTLTNVQTIPLSITSIAVSAPFEQQPGSTCGTPPASLAGGASCTIILAFSPTTVAAASQTLTVTDNAAISSQSVALTGTGITPVTLSSATLGFGSVVAGDTSAVKIVTLNNKENIALNFSSIATSGDFAIASGSTTCGTSLAAGAMCTVGVTFTPTMIAAETGTLTFTDDAANNPQTVALTGTGTTPVTVTPANENLAQTAIGNVGAAKTVTVTNKMNIALNFTSITPSANFTILSSTCGGSLAGGAMCTVGIAFAPTALGAAAGTLTFNDSAVNNPQTVSLSGTGTAPVTANKSSLTFAARSLGTTSAAQTVTVANNLTTSLNLSGNSVTGDFAISSASSTCGSSIAPGASCALGVTYTPTVVGAETGSLTINFGAFGSPIVVGLSGTGTATGLSSIAITPANSSISLGAAQQFTATGTFTGPARTVNVTTSVVWSSSLTGVATIGNTAGSQGLASGAGAGTTKIGATLNGVSGSTNLTVTGTSLISIAVTPPSPSIAAGLTQQFVATGTYSDNSTQNLTGSVTWMSATTSVATIAAGGLATGKTAGTSNITASIGGVTSPVDVLTVTPPILESIAVTPAGPSITVGLTQQFTATGTYSDNSTQNLTGSVTWTSGTLSVATFGAGGLATSVGVGTSNITASIGGVTSPVDVLTVTPPTFRVDRGHAGESVDYRWIDPAVHGDGNV